ncbi:MAG: transglycosylase SLT domain-containing protein [Gemmatimonadaceae bacterium]
MLVCLLATGQPSPVKDAETLIEQGHPWRATQTLAPVLRVSGTRTPETILVAARAAAGWGGWSEVDRLLATEPWIDSQFGGEARELLARSALDRNADALALSNASAAFADAGTADARAIRSVLLGRAFERNNMFDSAAAAYSRAAGAMPAIRDWLALRVAGSSSDSTARAREYSLISLAPARPRRAWTEAQARERFADALGAASRYAALGATVPALRLRLSVAPDSESRDTLQRELLAFIKSHGGTADARSAVEVLDKAFTSLAPAAELTVARSTAGAGPPARGIVAFQRALAGAVTFTPGDRLLYAQTLIRANRTREALAQFDLVTGPLASQAAYQRARAALNSATADAVRAGLRDVATRFSGDTLAASSALFLLADLTTDDGNDDAARTIYRQLYRAYPTSARAPNARFNAAMLTLVGGDSKAAAREFDSLFTTMPRSDEAAAARYWSGRAWSAAGNTTLARARWTELASSPAPSYYAVVAARRLDEKPWTPPARADSFAVVPSVDSAIARIALLDRLGMDVEARFEYDALEASALSSPDRALATAHAFVLRGQTSRAIRVAAKLVESGQRDARTYRLVFPLIDRDELVRDATARGLDPALVAGLIRQESNFNPRAISVANARGLMQVLPAVGEEVSRSLSFPVWNAALLLDADANLQLGTAHLASFVKQYGAIPRVLAAYNAGGSRVNRWADKAGAADPEIFAERIPFIETRDYVRIVQRNAEMYRALYTW